MSLFFNRAKSQKKVFDLSNEIKQWEGLIELSHKNIATLKRNIELATKEKDKLLIKLRKNK